MNAAVAAAEAALVDKFGAAGDLPDPSPVMTGKDVKDDKPWQYVNPSPCCEQMWCGRINYRICWYKCFRCGEPATVSWGWWWERRTEIQGMPWIVVRADLHYVSRFRAEVDGATRKWSAHFPCLRRLGLEEVQAYARWRICVYAGLMPREEVDRNPSDWNALEDWETAVKGDPQQMDRFVRHALNCDLCSLARHLIQTRTVKRTVDGREAAVDREPSLERAIGMDGLDGRAMERIQVKGRAVSRSAEDCAMMIVVPWGPDYPCVTLRYLFDLRVKEVAAMLGVSERTVRRRVRREMDALKPLLASQL